MVIESIAQMRATLQKTVTENVRLKHENKLLQADVVSLRLEVHSLRNRMETREAFASTLPVEYPRVSFVECCSIASGLFIEWFRSKRDAKAE